MDQIKLRHDNIPYLDQYELTDKLKMAIHPSINDQKIKQMIIQEIEKRKELGIWSTK